MAEKTTSAEPTQAQNLLAEPTQEQSSALLWFQEDNGAFVVYYGNDIAVRSHDWGNVLMYAHRNNLALAFSKREYRVGSYPLEGGTPVPPSNWCPADRIREVRSDDLPQQKNEGHYENYINAACVRLRAGFEFNGAKPTGPAGPTQGQGAKLAGPAGPTQAH